MKMTIKQMCEYHNCKSSVVYKKLEKHKQELSEHITIVGRTMMLDEYAIDFLLPQKIKNERYQYFNKTNNDYTESITEINSAILELKEQYYQLDEKVSELKNHLTGLSEIIDFLFQKNSEKAKPGMLSFLSKKEK